LITDWQHCKFFRPGGPNLLLDDVLEITPPRSLLAQFRLNPTVDPFLREHHFKKRPILPVVIAIEAFAEAAALLNGGEHTVRGLHSVEIHSALRFFTDRPINARVSAEQTADGIACRLTSDFCNRMGKLVEQDRVHFAGIVECREGEPAGGPVLSGHVPPVGIPNDWDDVLYHGADKEAAGNPAGRGVVDIRKRETHLFHGPPLRCLRQVKYDSTGGWGRILVPEKETLAGRRRGNDWIVTPAVLDACFLACGVWLWVHGDGTTGMPQGLGSLQLGRHPRQGEVCHVRLDCIAQDGQERLFDLTVFGDDGSTVMRINAYRALVVHVEDQRLTVKTTDERQ
jgi:hypothetical protein